jgi:hypothetical protein
MIAGSADAFFGHFLDVWSTSSDAIPAEVRAEYVRACRDAVPSIVADYRATATVDIEHDQADLDAGNRLTMPVTVVQQDWGRQLGFDATTTWRPWATDLQHFTYLPEGQLLVVVPGQHSPLLLGQPCNQLLQLGGVLRFNQLVGCQSRRRLRMVLRVTRGSLALGVRWDIGIAVDSHGILPFPVRLQIDAGSPRDLSGGGRAAQLSLQRRSYALDLPPLHSHRTGGGVAAV